MNKFNTAPIKRTKKSRWMKFQLLTTTLSKDNEYYRYKELIKWFEAKRKKHLSNIVKRVSDEAKLNTVFTNEKVITQISKLAEKEKIVMLNEMHWKPKHRVLASKLLKPLKDKGYKYLAIEAVDKEFDSFLNRRGFPTQNTGYYTIEPFFGLFIRKALKLGYKIIGYDDFETEDREKTQAINIKSIFDKDPTAKVFVYAGMDHILERRKSNSTKKRMPEIFKEITGINPLTIDQVELVTNTDSELTLLNSKLFSKGKKINSNVDYFVINNIKNPLNDFFKNTKHFYVKNKKLIDYNKKEVLFSLYFQDEYNKYKSYSTPIINRIKVVKNDCINVVLPIGKYHYTIRDIKNHKLVSKEIYVK